MESLTAIISFILLGGLVVSPFLILYGLNRLKIKFKFLTYFIFGTILTALIALTFAWWQTTSNQILLTHYGYDFNASNNTERFVNVAEENLERKKS